MGIQKYKAIISAGLKRARDRDRGDAIKRGQLEFRSAFLKKGKAEILPHLEAIARELEAASIPAKAVLQDPSDDHAAIFFLCSANKAGGQKQFEGDVSRMPGLAVLCRKDKKVIEVSSRRHGSDLKQVEKLKRVEELTLKLVDGHVEPVVQSLFK